jgi:exodeoxyribonuclease VII small subunit
MADDQSKLTYEEAYARLEEILEALEAGDLPLEKSLALYEEGAQLSTLCAQKLDEAELRVRKWQPGNETTSFEEWQES